MTTALVIGRLRPGRKIAEAVLTTTNGLKDAGWSADGIVVKTKGQIRRKTAKAVKDKVDVVVAVGGDGAVSQVIQSLAGTRVALGIIPMGTGNLLASNLGITGDPGKAMSVLTGGGHRRIDLGRLTMGKRKSVFAVACGIGFDAEVMDATARTAKVKLGKLAYVAGAIKRQGSVKDVVHKVTIDGASEAMEATQIMIANFGSMGPTVKAKLEVEPDDGLLDVIVIKASGPLGGLLAGWEALRQGEAGASPEGHVFRTRAKKVEVSSKSRRLVETDGSVVGEAPVRVSVRPGALLVRVPVPAAEANDAGKEKQV
jgi:YegS/Rv2252/BmrU family lipid kinase